MEVSYFVQWNFIGGKFIRIASPRIFFSATGKLMTLKEALLNQVGCQDKPDYFSVEATVLFIQSDKAIYLSCPTKDCKKKVKYWLMEEAKMKC